ncbi:NAD(P)/FAD-dependent oxidoreductase [Bordetella sp. FB-8]|uniref:NAD(P)/FAD-dependent oxidoreductase n=1 Tax=Bordetella sp. FB-8 TaxID=1159870 RepID=UPI0003A5456B|nr:NAD(P)/FAD-dependent oxidoreductase [Bordetella sp. FB-8]
MAIIPNMRTRITAAQPFSYVDNLFNYGAFIQGATTSIGTLPAAQQKMPIAVIGSGIAGLVAAYELMRAGALSVDIYEASPRFGGRAYSATFPGGPAGFLAELGAMRFPPSEFGLFTYLDRFGIAYSPNFPDPGKVDTKIGYQGRTYDWPAGGQPPAIFNIVNAGWNAFVSDGYQVPGGPALLAPAKITALLEAGDLTDAQSAWQQYIDVFENVSFYDGLVHMFTGANPPGGTPWAFPSDFQLFGALGLGSGGFGPLYAIGFLELVRLIVNELETSQQFVPGGIQSLATAFYKQNINGIVLGSRIQLGTAVMSVMPGAQGQPVLTLSNGKRVQYGRVVVATSNRAMQIDMGLSSSLEILNAAQSSALNEVHMTSSSKVFVLTKNKFWLANAGLPANIQTDTLVRGVYCLDYTPGNPNDPGVVLLSYTWEDDSIKQMAITDKQARVKRLVADVAQTSPAFASFVVPLNNDYENNVQMMDWDLQPYYYGAFKLNFPGDDGLSNQLFFQYMSSNNPSIDKYVYLAGDSLSYTGGWIEGAVQTGVNGACAVIRSLGGTFYTFANPIDTQNPKAYNYYP